MEALRQAGGGPNEVLMTTGLATDGVVAGREDVFAVVTEPRQGSAIMGTSSGIETSADVRYGQYGMLSFLPAAFYRRCAITIDDAPA